jgi:hypothetical protein
LTFFLGVLVDVDVEHVSLSEWHFVRASATAQVTPDEDEMVPRHAQVVNEIADVGHVSP